jgi:hypothetical protein
VFAEYSLNYTTVAGPRMLALWGSGFVTRWGGKVLTSCYVSGHRPAISITYFSSFTRMFR